jgi:hypothetical protein
MPMKHIENNNSGHYILRAFGRCNHGKSTGKTFDVRYNVRPTDAPCRVTVT